MESLKSSFIFVPPLVPLYSEFNHSILKKKKKIKLSKVLPIHSSIQPDPWSPKYGDRTRPKTRSRNPKKPLLDDNARCIIKAKAQHLSVSRRNQGPQAQTPRWIKRTPEQMVQYLQDDRNGHLYGKHVVAAIKKVRALSQLAEGEYNMRVVMGSFVGKLSFREMCIVLKEQKGWRQVRDFFSWMKLQLCYRPSVIVYTLILRAYGQVGKLKLAEETFLEMLDAGCEPDEVACGTMLCSYARWGRHKAMLSFYSAVKERGIVLSVTVFNFMLSSLQKKSVHREVVEIWRDMKVKEVVPNNFTFTVVIMSFIKEGLHEDAFKTFEEMKEGQFVPEEVTYNLLISLSVKNGKRDEAVRLYEDMRSQGIIPSNYTCASLLSLYYKYEDYSRALSLFSEMVSKRIPADEVIYGLLIRIYGKLGLNEDAQRTFEEANQLGLLTNEKTYLAMTQVHLTSGNVDKALETIELMKSRNLGFSRFAYIVLLQYYVMKEDLISAEGAFLALKKMGLPDAGSCNDMLNLYVGLGLVDKAQDFIVQVRENQLQFDEKLYLAVMKFYCKQGMVLEAEQLTEHMVETEYFQNNKFFRVFNRVLNEHSGHEQSYDKLMDIDELDAAALGLMLSLYLKSGNYSKAEVILKLLLDSFAGSNTVNQLVVSFVKEGEISKVETISHQIIKLGKLEDFTVASLISYYGKQHMLKQAEEVFREYVNSHRSGGLVYNSMIDAYVKCGKQREAYSLYNQVTEEGHDLGAVGISILVNALTNGEKHQEAESVVRRSLLANLELDTVAYNTFIKAMLEAGKLDFASSIYEHMCSLSVAPSIQTFNTMISVFGQDLKLDRAAEMFNKALALLGTLDEKTYMNLIGYYGKAGMIHDASLLFNKMQEEGIKPGKISYNIMINVYAVAGLPHEAEELFQAMQRQGCSPDSLSYLSLIRAYTQSLKYSEAEKTINAMQNNGVFPTCAHFNILLSAFTKVGLIDEANRVYKRLLSYGLTPDLICCRTMLRGYLEHGRVQEGINFFESINNSIKGDRFIFSAAVHFYKTAGKESKAEEILNTMDNLGIPLLRKIEGRSGSETQ